MGPCIKSICVSENVCEKDYTCTCVPPAEILITVDPWKEQGKNFTFISSCMLIYGTFWY